MKEAGTTHWNSPNTGATNSSGFSGLSGGYRGSFGSFYNLGYHGYWWSSSELLGTFASYLDLYYDYGETNLYGDHKAGGFSVRCLKN